MMSREIIAVVSTSREATGELPIIFAENEAEQQEIAFELGRILDGTVNRLPNGVIIIISS